MATIWAEVFGLDEIDVYDNFFELGGDSIKASRIIEKASKNGIKLTFRDILGYGAIADLVQALDSDAHG